MITVRRCHIVTAIIAITSGGTETFNTCFVGLDPEVFLELLVPRSNLGVNYFGILLEVSLDPNIIMLVTNSRNHA